MSYVPVKAGLLKTVCGAFAAILLSATLMTSGAQAGCKWQIPGGLTFIQSNGFTVSLVRLRPGGDSTSTRTSFEGEAYYRPTSGGGDTHGTIQGGVFYPNEMTALIRWDNGSQGSYSATINDDGRIPGGKTFDVNNPGSTATLSSTDTLTCVAAPPPPPPPPAPPEAPAPPAPPEAPPPAAPAGNVCTVDKPGDVYNDAGGRGQKIGELAAETQGVTLIEKEGADWYHVKWPAGQGWVYSGPGYPDALKCP